MTVQTDAFFIALLKHLQRHPGSITWASKRGAHGGSVLGTWRLQAGDNSPTRIGNLQLGHQDIENLLNMHKTTAPFNQERFHFLYGLMVVLEQFDYKLAYLIMNNVVSLVVLHEGRIVRQLHTDTLDVEYLEQFWAARNYVDEC